MRRSILARARYALALIRQFRVTLGLTTVVFFILPILLQLRYRTPGGGRITFGKAFHHVYFLLFGGPSLEYVDDPLIELLNVAVPMLGIAVVVDGIARFTALIIARERNAREWVTVLTSTWSGHVVVCGAGRVGFRVATQLRELGQDVVVLEKQRDATFVAPLLDLGIPVLFDDIRTRGALERANVKAAAAIAAVTDDDLANLNVALDARRLNPQIRLVMRLFDEDLMATIRHTLGAEALSTSMLAAPHLALAALDPAIVHSFRVGKHLMVVGRLKVTPRMTSETVKDLRDAHGALTLAIHRGADEELHPPGLTRLTQDAELTVQAEWDDWRRLRAWAEGR